MNYCSMQLPLTGSQYFANLTCRDLSMYRDKAITGRRVGKCTLFNLRFCHFQTDTRVGSRQTEDDRLRSRSHCHAHIRELPHSPMSGSTAAPTLLYPTHQEGYLVHTIHHAKFEKIAPSAVAATRVIRLNYRHDRRIRCSLQRTTPRHSLLLGTCLRWSVAAANHPKRLVQLFCPSRRTVERGSLTVV
ncbi:hypothetical protein CERZMDRAFT_91151 [Cercospora zeae-maydis SCOH1-5]|uniref:Uncharacterized protein n=1 Tax=Cercospora zeae-maydis SCOH1-5 TaxID=717836 RepID=A0A6A6FAB1_9PEZI|nr:hypothetical protein CERZMDRAFT_91151 [Cercospora zeae-maydis SCOH1-5]